MRIVGLDRPRTRKDALEPFGGNGPDRGRVDRLPEGPAELRISAFPQRTTNVANNQGAKQHLLIAVFPDAALVKVQAVVDTAGQARRSTSEEPRGDPRKQLEPFGHLPTSTVWLKV